MPSRRRVYACVLALCVVTRAVTRDLVHRDKLAGGRAGRRAPGGGTYRAERPVYPDLPACGRGG